MENWIFIIVTLIIGVIVGILCGKKIFKPKIAGRLIVDRMDPDGPFLFLEAHVPMEKIVESKYLSFTVDTNGLHSQ